MSCEISLTIVQARNLPIMDKKRQTTDTYCVVTFDKKKIKTANDQANAGINQNENTNVWQTPVIFKSINP